METPKSPSTPTETSPSPTSTAAGTTPPAGTPPTGPDNTKAIVTLVLGILSLLCCGFFSGIPAILLGRVELKAIDEGRSAEENRGLTKAGFILGLVGTILSCLGILAYLAIIALAVIAQKSGPATF